MTNYSLMGNDITNSAGDGPPNFPFGIKQSTGFKDIANAPYTITNSDGFNYIYSGTNLTASRAVVLPLASANIGRVIKIKKIDSGAFPIAVSLSGADTLDNQTAVLNLPVQFAEIFVRALANGAWVIDALVGIPPTQTIYTATGAGSYTVPAYVKKILVQMVGGGAGGGSGGTALGGAAGSAGGSTTFGTSLLTCGGGGFTAWSTTVAAAATATINAPAIGVARSGMRGAAGQPNSTGAIGNGGGMGGSTPFGSGGPGGAVASGPQAAVANSGGGGGGSYGGGTAGALAGSGGGSGAYIEAVIFAPSLLSPIAFSVGIAGTGAGPGANGDAGAAGAAGKIVITEYFWGT
jgi:hypothetical protein